MSPSIAHFIYLDRAQAGLCGDITAPLADFAPGQLGRKAGADVLFSLFSDHSWGLFTVAMVAFISIAAALLFLGGK